MIKTNAGRPDPDLEMLQPIALVDQRELSGAQNRLANDKFQRDIASTINYIYSTKFYQCLIWLIYIEDHRHHNRHQQHHHNQHHNRLWLNHSASEDAADSNI